MSFYNIEDSISDFTIGQAIYEAALLIAVLRWVFCLVFRVINSRRRSQTQSETSSSSWESSNFNTLPLTTFGEIMERLPETEDTCAVCLNQLKDEDEVRELMNCYHVFHKECIDRWLEHDHESENHNPTCPLCRAPLLSSCCMSSESSSCVPPPQPSWAVERLLYLFGDDLLPC